MKNHMEQAIYNLIKKASASIPEDVGNALNSALDMERNRGNVPAADRIEQMIENIRLAGLKQRPLCQDTGIPNFFVELPLGTPRSPFETAAKAAVAEATANGLLRPNSVCPITGKNTGDNLGPGTPAFHWNETDNREIRVQLLLKGGGSENVGAQYSLPNTELNAERSLDGAAKCVLDAVKRAGGKGCPPYIVSVCLGGDRAGGYAAAKNNFLREIGERSTIPELANLERGLLAQINALGIGPMGLGGATTALDVFATALNRLPASYFVTVSLMCWSFRRAKICF